MLVLSRKQGESIIIGGDIVVTIVEVRGGQVRVGIDAPRSIDVHREEIYQEVLRENVAAVESAGVDSAMLKTRVGDRAKRQARRSASDEPTSPDPGEPSDE